MYINNDYARLVTGVQYCYSQNSFRGKNFLQAMRPDYIMKLAGVRQTKNHLRSNIRYCHNGTQNELTQILSSAKTVDELSFVSKLQKNILKNDKNAPKTILEFLSSPFKGEFISNIDKYLAFVQLNKESETVVRDLESLIKSGQYKKENFETKLEIKKLKGCNIINFDENFTKAVEDNYSPERASFLRYMQNTFLAYRVKTCNEFKPIIIDMYKTVNKQNLDIRKTLLYTYRYNNYGKTGLQENYDELVHIQKIFDKIDKDSQAFKLVNKIIKNELQIERPSVLNTILETVPPKKAIIFFDNLRNIVDLSQDSELEYALRNHLEDCFFIPESKKYQYYNNITYGYTNKDSIITKLNKKIVNMINKFRYYKLNKVKDDNPASKTAALFSYESPKIVESEPSQAIDVLPIKPTKKIKETSKERKIRLSREVNEYVKNKLGKSTYDKQEDNYKIKVTKMRLNMLPEIFDSINATRAQALSKSIRPKSSNKDALKLYELINGKNKKLIRFMLRKCDNGGNRIFDVKDTITFISEAENINTSLKKSNHDFKARDAKEFYDDLFNQMVEMYGKLKPVRKFRTGNEAQPKNANVNL